MGQHRWLGALWSGGGRTCLPGPPQDDLERTYGDEAAFAELSGTADERRFWQPLLSGCGVARTRREGTMAARLLLLLVVMLVFAALYGCAREAAQDRQPMKRVKEPTTAEIAPHTPEESDDHVRRGEKGGGGGG